MSQTILVTGGGGYVGARLVPRLLAQGYGVRAFDWFIFGEEVLAQYSGHPKLQLIRGDIRDSQLLCEVVPGCDSVIHLAGISNDASFELDRKLAMSVNYHSLAPLVQISRASGVARFIFASSASVYGVSSAQHVTEDHPLVPITDYNRYKARCEDVLHQYQGSDFTTVVVRPATICGYSPRQRFDLTVNIFTNQAVNSGQITVFGGTQTRPNLHIEDMVDAYLLLLETPAAQVMGETFNVGCENLTLSEIAELVCRAVQRHVPERREVQIATVASADPRSYHISSRKIERRLGFIPRRTIENGVLDLIRAFQAGKLPDPLRDPKYFNIKKFQALGVG